MQRAARLHATSAAIAIAALAALAAAALSTAPPTPTAPPAPPAAQRLADHVVLVSIDGLRPEMYRDTSWPAPMLQQMAREGAQAEAVFGVFPSVTYPTHTTIVTGALPARHGVYYNTPFEPAGPTGRWVWEASAIRVPTLWTAARQAGLTTAAVSWPVTVGADVDWNVPEIWPLEKDGSIVAELRRHATPPGLVDELERDAVGKLRDEIWQLGETARDDRVGEMAAHLLQTRKPALLLVHLLTVDHFEHDHGRDHAMVRRALGAADRALARMVEAAERAGIRERTAFVVTGDHGFSDVHSKLAPNVWLVAAGLRAARRDRGDWRATFHVSSASAFLYLRDPADADAFRRVREVLAAQPAGVRRLFRVVERDELDRLGAAPDAALALAYALGVGGSGNFTGEAVLPGSGGDHGYLPDERGLQTGLVAWGAGVQPNAIVPRMSSADVAPLVARLLGLSFDAPDGALLPGVLREPAAALPSPPP
ncbi:MAG TPA: alkaline phosphatase family protein [Thermoanaerobaculia bacterium]|nr:alkaline phosphatase family protein [Thermoanaerobaculia bacterium]